MNWGKSSFSVSILSVFGGILIVGSALLATGLVYSLLKLGWKDFCIGTPDLAPNATLSLPAIWGFVAGGGLVLRRRWAAILCSIPCGILGALLFLGARVSDSAVLNCMVAVMLLLPFFLLIAGWGAFMDGRNQNVKNA